jgi:catechol-2,3-dioxygenase
MASLRSVVMMLRDVPKTLTFFQSALQLPVISAAPHQAMLQAGTSTLVLVQAKDEASCTTGYSPFLTFAVRDFDDAVVRLLQAGANLDGPIKHPHTGKVMQRAASSIYVCASAALAP